MLVNCLPSQQWPWEIYVNPIYMFIMNMTPLHITRLILYSSVFVSLTHNREYWKASLSSSLIIIAMGGSYRWVGACYLLDTEILISRGFGHLFIVHVTGFYEDNKLITFKMAMK